MRGKKRGERGQIRAKGEIWEREEKRGRERGEREVGERWERERRERGIIMIIIISN